MVSNEIPAKDIFQHISSMTAMTVSLNGEIESKLETLLVDHIFAFSTDGNIAHSFTSWNIYLEDFDGYTTKERTK